MREMRNEKRDHMEDHMEDYGDWNRSQTSSECIKSEE